MLFPVSPGYGGGNGDDDEIKQKAHVGFQGLT